ncbi:hypothetical protein Q1695_002163 [Nippostrongylus brasiliensis]|nr:hypothetical protein Q1695_002163 [Nippostrongylus brasiliensis]
MSETYRNVALGLHNDFRSHVAVGLTARNGFYGNNEIAPPAGLMYRLKYSCEAEMAAYNHVITCDQKPTPRRFRWGWKENYQVLKTVHTDELGALQNAIAQWTGFLATIGLPYNMLYTRRIDQGSLYRILTKMLWAKNQHVGCATHRCHGFYFTSCMYSDITDALGQSIYPVAAVCSQCPSGNHCELSNGLCDTKAF